MKIRGRDMKRDKKREGDRQALDRYREEVDRIDKQILSLLSRRQGLAALIGELKGVLGINIFNPAREEEVLRRLVSNRQKDLTPEVVRHIFSEIISAARSVQQPLTIAFLGPEATFSHQAAISLFGRSASFLSAETIEKVFELVEKGTCQRGVVAVENSYEGSVGSNMDLLYQYELKISAELFLRIRHHLLSREDNISKIKYLYSHPMAIAQCHSWIKVNLPKVIVKETKSTSLATKLAADEPHAAAVGSQLSAHHYGLKILKEDIEDNPQNVTRFLAIGKSAADPTGRDKTALLFSLRHEPGALHKVLEPLAQRNISLTRIESRPMKTRNWEYLFFVDLEGHEEDSNLREAVREMQGHCAFIKRLGSFPAGGEPWD
jgi:chorismate mutase/prephenate dehydratase